MISRPIIPPVHTDRDRENWDENNFGFFCPKGILSGLTNETSVVFK